MNRRTKNLLLYIASALIPFVLLLAALAYTESVPFGNNSILWRDAKFQYLDFAAYLKTILQGENNILYSFSKNLGGEMVSLLSYYLASPFNLLFALASNATLPAVFTLVAVLKMSLCGLTFFHASTRLWGYKPVHLAFSTAYALMAYNVLYGWSIMWLDGVLVLPLVGLALYYLWEGRKPWLYILSLAYGLFTNFYIGYMLCIASVLFSLVHMVLMTGSLREKACRFGKFLGASCLGGFASALLWLPAFLMLLEGRATVADEAAGILINFNIMSLGGKLVAGAASLAQVNVGTPHIFCGTLTLFLAMVFFLNRGISGKIRLVCLGVLAVLMVSFLLRPINIIWHGFSPNYAFNFRYAFIFSYVMLMIAQYALIRMDSVGKKQICFVAVIILLLILGLLAIREMIKLEFLSTSGCLISLLAMVLIFGVHIFAKKNSLICAVLVLVTVLEMGANCSLSWKAVISDPQTDMLQMDQYQIFLEKLTPAVEYVKSADSGLYRMEKTIFYDEQEPVYNVNNSMFFGYNGLSHFSSSQQKHILGLMEKLGLKNYKNIWSYYNQGATAEVDALLGVKYLLSQKDMEAVKGYEKHHTVNDIHIYENPNALPVAFLTQPEVLAVNMEEPDYFALHNAIWESVSGVSEPVLHAVEDVTVTLENLQHFSIGGGNTRYVRIDPQAPASICYSIRIHRELPLYYYFTAAERQDAEIYVNGGYNGNYFNDARWDMSCAGTFRAGETVEVKIQLTEEQMVLADALFYYEDLNALACHSDAIMQQPVTVVPESSSHLTGTFTAREGQMLMFTIPYDTGWKLYVDGAPCAYSPVLDALMAAEVPAGTHTYELRYVPRGAVLGCSLTAAALTAIAIWYCMEKKKGDAYETKE